ncbi:MAG: hypothetical protein ACR2JB_20155 [Bryobacteraceae bacterium]
MLSRFAICLLALIQVFAGISKLRYESDARASETIKGIVLRKQGRGEARLQSSSARAGRAPDRRQLLRLNMCNKLTVELFWYGLANIGCGAAGEQSGPH